MPEAYISISSSFSTIGAAFEVAIPDFSIFRQVVVYIMIGDIIEGYILGPKFIGEIEIDSVAPLTVDLIWMTDTQVLDSYSANWIHSIYF